MEFRHFTGPMKGQTYHSLPGEFYSADGYWLREPAATAEFAIAYCGAPPPKRWPPIHAVAEDLPGAGLPAITSPDRLYRCAKLSIDVLPVSSQGGDSKSPISAKRAGAMVDALAARLAQLSGHA